MLVFIFSEEMLMVTVVQLEMLHITLLDACFRRNYEGFYIVALHMQSSLIQQLQCSGRHLRCKHTDL